MGAQEVRRFRLLRQENGRLKAARGTGLRATPDVACRDCVATPKVSELGDAATHLGSATVLAASPRVST
jgi:hypothetical protein